MYKFMGANFNVLPKSFSPNFIIDAGYRVHVILDACHMQNIVRNTLARNGKLFDERNNAIEWKHLEYLVNRTNNEKLNIIQKLNENNLDWKKKIMNVEIACQTLSATTANALQFCKDRGFEEFSGVDPLIKFIRLFNGAPK